MEALLSRSCKKWNSLCVCELCVLIKKRWPWDLQQQKKLCSVKINYRASGYWNEKRKHRREKKNEKHSRNYDSSSKKLSWLAPVVRKNWGCNEDREVRNERRHRREMWKPPGMAKSNNLIPSSIDKLGNGNDARRFKFCTPHLQLLNSSLHFTYICTVNWVQYAPE